MSAIQIDLPKTMRSVMCYGPRDYRFEEIAVPKVKPGEVLVKILGAGICAGDTKCYSGAPLFWGDEYRQGYCQPPVTPGHEFVERLSHWEKARRKSMVLTSAIGQSPSKSCRAGNVVFANADNLGCAIRNTMSMGFVNALSARWRNTCCSPLMRSTTRSPNHSSHVTRSTLSRWLARFTRSNVAKSNWATR